MAITPPATFASSFFENVTDASAKEQRAEMQAACLLRCACQSKMSSEQTGLSVLRARRYTTHSHRAYSVPFASASRLRRQIRPSSGSTSRSSSVSLRRGIAIGRSRSSMESVARLPLSHATPPLLSLSRTSQLPCRSVFSKEQRG